MLDEKDRGDWIETYRGKKFYFMTPEPDDIHIRDIAQGLGMTCRFSGQCNRFYSVAQHSFILADYFISKGQIDLAKWALLHDASEAYIADIARPVKPYLTNYKTIETGIMEVVCDRFGLPHYMPEEVKEADSRILLNEREVLLPNSKQGWDVDHLSPLDDVSFDIRNRVYPEKAVWSFLSRFTFLFPGEATDDQD